MTVGRPWARRRVAGLALALGLLLAGVGTTAPAQAHAYTVSTTPANGAELQAAPTEVRVTFDEPVSLPAGGTPTVVLDAGGTDVGNGAASLVDGRRTLVIGLRPDLAKGAYIASWSVVSADTHPVGGSLQFGYGVPATALTAPAAPEPSAVLELFVGVVKGLLYLGLVAALGLVPAALLLGAAPAERRALWRAARVGVAVAGAASVLQVVVQYLWDASAVPGGPCGSGFAAFLASSYAATVGVRIGLLALAVVLLPPAAAAWSPRTSLTTGTTLRWAGTGLVAVAVLASVVRLGHGAGTWWTFASTLVHVGAVVAWLGGLAALGWLLLARPSAARLARLPRWSAYAATSVALLVGTGTLQALVQVRHPAAVVETTYGAVLLVKLALVGATLVLGLLGHRWVRGGDPAARRLASARTRIRAEAALGALVVIVSGVLSSTPPAEVTYAPQRVVDRVVGPYAVQVTIAPARRGPQSFRVVATGRSAAVAPATSIGLTLDGGPDDAVRALPVSFPYRLPGAIAPGTATPFTFISPSVNVPRTGTWTGTLTLVASPTLQYTDRFTYEVL